MDEINNPLELLEQARLAAVDAEKAERRFNRLTREVFTSPKGRQWLRLAISRFNFMGSVFSDEDNMNPHRAAYRDGMRGIISEIINSAATNTNQTKDDDDE